MDDKVVAECCSYLSKDALGDLYPNRGWLDSVNSCPIMTKFFVNRGVDDNT